MSNAMVGITTGCLLLGEYIEKVSDDSMRKLEYYEFKEGPEKFNWIENDRFKQLHVVHKYNETLSPGRYLFD